MAPSSTPSAASRREALALAARDARQAAMDRCLGGGLTLVTASLAVPGEEKAPAGAVELLAWAGEALSRAIPGARRIGATWDALGPFELWTAPGDAAEVKRRCVALEAAAPAARLLDLDVYSPEGTPVDRAALHLPSRACLCCPEPARDCIRSGRHDGREVVGRALGLLAAFRRPPAG